MVFKTFVVTKIEWKIIQVALLEIGEIEFPFLELNQTSTSFNH